MHAIQQCLRRLRTLKIVRVLCPPCIELNALPACRQVLMQKREGIPQLASAEHVHVLAPPAVRIWPKDPAAENAAHVLEWLQISPMHADLERGLLAVPCEGTFPDDQTHRVTERKRFHGPNNTLSATCTQGATFHIAMPDGTYANSAVVAGSAAVDYLGVDRKCQRAITDARIVSSPASTGTLAAATSPMDARMSNGRGGPGTY